MMMNFAAAQRFIGTAIENLDFEQGMNSLTAVIGGNVEDVTSAFKKWCTSTPFPWRVALDYCLQRASQGKSLPFTVDVHCPECRGLITQEDQHLSCSDEAQSRADAI